MGVKAGRASCARRLQPQMSVFDDPLAAIAVTAQPA